MQGPYSQPLERVHFSQQGMNNNISVDDIWKKLDIINKRLGKLDAIDDKLSVIDRSVTELDQTVHSINDRVKSLEQSRQFESETDEVI